MEEDKRKIFRDLYKYKSTKELKWWLMANYRGLWQADKEAIAAIEQLLGERRSKAGKKAWGTEKEMLLFFNNTNASKKVFQPFSLINLETKPK